MIIGSLNKRITLRVQSGTKIVDGLEQPIYTDGATMWAAAEPLRGREFWQAQAVQAEQIISFRIRYIKGIQNNWRVKLEGVEYEITSIIDPNMKHEELQLLCKVVS